MAKGTIAISYINNRTDQILQSEEEMTWGCRDNQSLPDSGETL